MCVYASDMIVLVELNAALCEIHPVRAATLQSGSGW